MAAALPAPSTIDMQLRLGCFFIAAGTGTHGEPDKNGSCSADLATSLDR
jgi:hypothetical protein